MKIKVNNFKYTILSFNCLIISFLFLTSCGSKNKLKHKVDTKTDSTAIVKSVITSTITEKLDTNIVIKKDSLKRIITVNQLNKGDTIKTHENNITIETYEDPKTKNITEKIVTDPKLVHAFIDKETKSAETINADVHVKKDITEKDITVERSGLSWKVWAVIIFFVLLLLVLLYLYLRKKFPILP